MYSPLILKVSFSLVEQKRDVSQNVYASLFHTMKVNGDWGCQAPKRTKTP